MIRTQIQLTEAQARQLRDRARQEGVSLAALIRRCIDESLKSEPANRADLYARASKLVGRFRDRRRARDVSSEHDKYLDEALD